MAAGAQNRAVAQLLSARETTMFLQRQAGEEGGIAPEELRQFSILSGLSNHELAQLIQLGELRHAQPGEIIIKRGDPGDALFFVWAAPCALAFSLVQRRKPWPGSLRGIFWRHGDVYPEPKVGRCYRRKPKRGCCDSALRLSGC